MIGYLDFYDYVSNHIVKGEKNYLIFDELQAVTHWEKAIESFRLDFDVDIYITGSNAYLLSSEFSTLLSGRYVEIRLLPLSFAEFLTFYSSPPSVTMEDKIQKYLQFGSMPILKQFDFNTTRVNEVLESIYSTVILRDVLERNKAIDQALLSKLVMFLADNIGSVTSPNNIGNVLPNEGEIGREKGKNKLAGKLLLKTLGKNYIIDLGFRNMLLGYRDADRGHILEYVVFLQLLRRHCRVSIGKIGETEVDFIAEKPDEKLYIQVTETMSGEAARERELRSLMLINDNYEKIVYLMFSLLLIRLKLIVQQYQSKIPNSSINSNTSYKKVSQRIGNFISIYQIPC